MKSVIAEGRAKKVFIPKGVFGFNRLIILVIKILIEYYFDFLYK